MKSLSLNTSTPERLDNLASQSLGMSRSQVQKAIKAGSILVNGKEASAKTLIDSSMDISYDESILRVPEKSGSLPVLDLLFEDDDVIVINKPAGVLVHEAEQS